MADASQKQIDFINGLVRERTVSDDAKRRIATLIADGMDVGKAHEIIEYLKAQPKSAKAAPETPHTDVPAGRYAIVENGIPYFYQVDRPDKGRWSGYIFVNQLFGAPGDFRRVGVKNADARYAVLAKIAVDVIGASTAFGKEHGVCGVCGSPLTNKESIELGIGPVCLGRLEAAPAPAPAESPEEREMREEGRILFSPAQAAAVRQMEQEIARPAKSDALPATFAELAARAKS